MKAHNSITIVATVRANIDKVWSYWSLPEHINKWAFATEDWEAKDSANDLRIGGKFNTVMAAKDGSAHFNFSGTYTNVTEHEQIAYDLDDGRHVNVDFQTVPEGVRITVSFEPEEENPLDMQENGWQQILNNFKKYTEEMR